MDVHGDHSLTPLPSPIKKPAISNPTKSQEIARQILGEISLNSHASKEMHIQQDHSDPSSTKVDFITTYQDAEKGHLDAIHKLITIPHNAMTYPEIKQLVDLLEKWTPDFGKMPLEPNAKEKMLEIILVKYNLTFKREHFDSTEYKENEQLENFVMDNTFKLAQMSKGNEKLQKECYQWAIKMGHQEAPFYLAELLIKENPKNSSEINALYQKAATGHGKMAVRIKAAIAFLETAQDRELPTAMLWVYDIAAHKANERDSDHYFKLAETLKNLAYEKGKSSWVNKYEELLKGYIDLTLKAADLNHPEAKKSFNNFMNSYEKLKSKKSLTVQEREMVDLGDKYRSLRGKYRS